jgi:hypothetical protein
MIESMKAPVSRPATTTEEPKHHETMNMDASLRGNNAIVSTQPVSALYRIASKKIDIGTDSKYPRPPSLGPTT